MTCIVYKGVSRWEGGGGWADGPRKPEIQAAQVSAQELTETVTVGLGLDHGKGRGGRTCRWPPGTSLPPY